MTKEDLEANIRDAIKTFEQESGRTVDAVEYWPTFSQPVVFLKYDVDLDGPKEKSTDECPF